MKRLLSAVSLALLTVASVAAADQAAPQPTAKSKKASHADVFESLAKSKLEIAKSITLPKTIPSTEKTDGVYVETPPHFKNSGQPASYAMIYSSKEDAAARNSGQPQTASPTCFMNAYPNYNADINWSGSLGTSTTIQNYKNASYPGAPQYGSVQLVRSDRIVSEEKNKLTYEVKLVFVDADTLGARLHSKQLVEFSLVDELPGKVKVWGARSDDQVTFMVRRERHEEERFFTGPLMVTVNGQHAMSGSEACPVMFSLKTGKSSAQSAVVQLETVLSIQEQDKDEEGEGPSFISQMPIRARSAPVGGFGQKEAKVRPMRIGVSSTWMSQDTRPVVSVSHGWSGRERTQAI